MHCLVAATAPGARPWTFCAISLITSGNIVALSTTRCTRPHSIARFMLQFSAVTKSFFALAIPVVRITCGEITAGITPSFTSESVMCAVLTATAMSQAERSPTPPPIAEPFRHAMVNCGSVAHSYRSRDKSSELLFLPDLPDSSSCCAVAAMSRPSTCGSTWPSSPAFTSACDAWNDLGSPPAQNMRPLPVSTAMRTSGRLFRMRMASWKPSLMASFIALLAVGRLSVQ
mmetsp:Transcript_42146/g.111376  ORF Transcript_42146/g.111376 Transcript_42146/m.111376 type:complete len:229 (+) Transcript_42146:208-894(+)